MPKKTQVNWSMWIPVILSLIAFVSAVTLKILDKIEFSKPSVTVVTNYIVLKENAPAYKSSRVPANPKLYTTKPSSNFAILNLVTLTNTTSKTNRTYGIYFNFKK